MVVNDFNCVFECDKKCVNKQMAAFENILCIDHLKEVWGLKPEITEHRAEEKDYITGPFFMLDDDMTYQAGTVLWPTKELIDRLYITHSELTHDKTYSLNPRMSIFINKLMQNNFKSNNRNNANRFQFEVLRNLLTIGDPTLAYETKTEDGLLMKLKKRFSDLTHYIKAEPFYDYTSKSIEISDYYDATFTIKDLSIFEHFFLFCCFSSQTQFDSFVLPFGLNMNLAWINNIGYVITRRICNPESIVVDSRYAVKKLYINLKTTYQQKSIVKTRYNSSFFPDANKYKAVTQHLNEPCFSRRG